MKKYVFFLFTLFFVLSCTNNICSDKKTYLNNYKAFVATTELNYKKYSKEDWEISNQKFKKFRDSCYQEFESQLTSEEEDMVFNYTTRYLLVKVKNVFNSGFSDEKLNEYSKKFKKLFNKNRELDIDIEDFKNDKDLQKSVEDFEKGIDKFGDGLEKLGQGLDKFFQKLDESLGENKKEDK